jgi:hypothetical protein
VFKALFVEKTVTATVPVGKKELPLSLLVVYPYLLSLVFNHLLTLNSKFL